MPQMTTGKRRIRAHIGKLPLEDSAETVGLRRKHALVAAPLVQNGAGSVEQPDAEPRGAPVGGGEGRVTAAHR